MGVQFNEPQETPPAASLAEEKLKALEADGQELPVEESTLPRFRVELLCPTPVELRIAEYHAENPVEAEVLHRRANGLPGAIAGAMRTTRLVRDAATGEWVEQV